MGKAIIVSNYGEGYYRIRLLYDFTKLDAEILRLEEAQSEYIQNLYLALKDYDLAADNCVVAANNLNAVIQQYIDGLIKKLDDIPPAIEAPEEIDPETGLPYTDPALAFAKDLFDRVNDERGANALNRNETLDEVAKRHLFYQSNSNTISHFGEYYTNPETRVLSAGYSSDKVGETLSAGERTAEQVVANWLKYQSSVMLDSEFTEVGCAYLYARTHPWGYLWCMVYAHPGEPLLLGSTVIQEAAKEVDSALDSISIPQQKEMTERLSKASAEYAKTVQIRQLADKKIAKLMAETLQRDNRIFTLNQLKNRLDAIELSAWSAEYNDVLQVGVTVETIEVPGYYDTGINIRPYGSIIPYTMNCGVLRPSESMTPELVFFNLAIEPGHLKWRPLWRYGIITDMGNGNGATVLLDEVQSREGDGLSELDIDPASPASMLYNVPFRYMWCHEDAFEVGDNVLVLFEGFNRDSPKIIGFKDHPRSCNGRISWRELWNRG